MLLQMGNLINCCGEVWLKKISPELTPEIIVREGSADDVCGDVYVCICMCNTCFDEIMFGSS